ncbi:Hsp70 family protein [Halapricum sp. CBA1109]|nr:Hsp70 family protein [Halapricum sp. CBA1109]MUV91100.1 Hsp70 family protein [Halapricum sp. CBA1109]
MVEGYSVGIDLGTTNSAIAAVTGDEPEIIPNSDGERTTPSVVMIDDNDETVVGQAAANQAVSNPDRTVQHIKRHIGDEDYVVDIGDEEYRPEQISALILTRLLADGESYLGRDVDSAVITVPAYFGDAERQATRSAGEIAGIDVEHVMTEPTAACLAYGLQETAQSDDAESHDKRHVFVYDLGGGTFDATLVEIDLEHNHIEVQNTDGDRQLGGEDWTQRIVDHLADIAQEEGGVDVAGDHEQEQRLYDAAVRAKHDLSNREQTEITVPYLGPDYNLETTLTREEFQDLTEDLLDRTVDNVDELFDRADMGVDDVDEVLLIGGATRMAQVADTVEDYFGTEPLRSVNPDEAVAMGAATQAELMSSGGDTTADDVLPGDEDLLLVDVTPQPIGIELHDGTFAAVVDQDEKVPIEESDDRFTTVMDDQTGVRFPIYQAPPRRPRTTPNSARWSSRASPKRPPANRPSRSTSRSSPTGP